MKCRIAFAVFGVIGIGYFTYTWMRQQLEPTTWTIPITVKLSPSGAWRAWVDETVYEGMFVTVTIDRVYLVAKDDPDKILDVAAVETDEDEANRPRIDWTAPNVLQVTAANLSYVTVQRRAYKDVRIDLRFDPDDPAARAVWLKRLNEEPDPHPSRDRDSMSAQSIPAPR